MDLIFAQAKRKDIPHLVDLLAEDLLGREREDNSRPIALSYVDAFDAIDADPNNQLLVVRGEGKLVGMLQLTFIPYLTHQGSWRCLIEGVRIHQSFRGLGIGEKMFQHAIALAKTKGCQIVQLTSDKLRPDALRFYEKLGFKATHEGFKLGLTQ
ncbi:MAG: GNAT family N-acetyltransferase [Alteromonadaceae bacterium]|nr:GNAT family N-acetyltransferase [Alteromonadaceae bacterium]